MKGSPEKWKVFTCSPTTIKFSLQTRLSRHANAAHMQCELLPVSGMRSWSFTTRTEREIISYSIIRNWKIAFFIFHTKSLRLSRAFKMFDRPAAKPRDPRNFFMVSKSLIAYYSSVTHVGWQQIDSASQQQFVVVEKLSVWMDSFLRFGGET